LHAFWVGGSNAKECLPMFLSGVWNQSLEKPSSMGSQNVELEV
jgi:hypothetical protein